MLLTLVGVLGWLFFWATVFATVAAFGTTAVMALLSWGFFSWFHENAPSWERTFSQASAFFLIAVNGAGVFLGPLTMAAARNGRRMPDFSEPFWVRGWWQAILVLSLLLTLSALLATAWEPKVLGVLGAWWLLGMITNVWLSAIGAIAVSLYFAPPTRGRKGYRSQTCLLWFLLVEICVRTALVLAVVAGGNDAVFGMKAGPVDDRPQMLEACFWAELTVSLLLIASPNLAKLGRAFFLGALVVASLATAGAWYRVLHPLEGAPPLNGWYPIWLTAVPLALSLCTAIRQYHPTLFSRPPAGS